jgi:hypothetical protein
LEVEEGIFGADSIGGVAPEGEENVLEQTQTNIDEDKSFTNEGE